MGYRSGFVAIIGRANVGKSTLMNALIGRKVSIVSERPQTTRNRIMGVYSHVGGQVVFVDTPGVHTPRTRLGEFMVKEAFSALEGVDAVVLVLDAHAGIGRGDRALLARVARGPALIVALNKVDVASDEQVREAMQALAEYPDIRQVAQISALAGQGLEDLAARLLEMMPEGPQYFPDGMVTDQPERVLCAELIREKALEFLRDEIPHGIGVDVERMEAREDKDILDIRATIYCERESHKGMVIGKAGAMLERIGTSARRDIERLMDMQVNLQLWVKAKPGWRNSAGSLSQLGYFQK